MKKITVFFVISVLIISALSVTAFAHGHRRGMYARAQQSYSVCDIEDCNTTVAHYHGNTCYYGHHIGDGHDYHQLCNVSGCDLTGTHEHDGETHFGHYNGDGHDYHNYGRNNGGFHH